MADVFIGGLAAGLILLAALLLVANASWSGVGFASTSWFAPSRGPQPELVTAELGNSYQVGRIITNTVLESDLGQFDISGIAQQQSLPSGIVQSGVLFGEQSLRYSINNPKSITFTVNRTNGYGPLLIKADGKVLYESDLALGEHTVPLGMEGPVELEFSVPSSGWKLWAPVLYEITNVNVRSTHPQVEYDFGRGEDFSWAELILTLSSYQGTLDVNLNGEQLWSGSPGSAKTVSFYEDDVDETNVLTLVARSGSRFAGTAKLVLHYVHRQDKTYETAFNLTSAQMDKLPGHIVFEVPSVQDAGTVVVKLVAGDQVKLAEAIDTGVGTDAVAFYKSNIVPGSPMKLVIESSDALFYIRNLKVWV